MSVDRAVEHPGPAAPTAPGRGTQAATAPGLTRRAVLATAAAIVATGCARRTPRPSEDLVWAVGAIDAAPGGPASDVAALWNDHHRGDPRIRVEALPQAADEQRHLMAIELNAGLRGFDILSLDVPWTGEFAVNGWLANLGDLRDVITKAALPGPLRSATWKGQLWAAPFTTSAGLLYYRSDLVPDVPRSWDELVRVGHEAADRAGIEPFVGQGAQYEGMVVQYLELLWGAGGDLFNGRGTAVDFEEGPALRALEFMSEARRSGFYARGFPTMTEDGARAAFQAGRAVFMRNWPPAEKLLRSKDSAVRDTFGIAPLPTLRGGGTVSAVGGQNLAVSRFSRNAEAAKEFVQFASTTAQVQLHLATEHSVPPAMRSVYADLKADQVMQLLAEILPASRARPPAPQWSAISDEIQQAVYPAYNGQREPVQAVRDVRRFLELTLRSSGR